MERAEKEEDRKQRPPDEVLFFEILTRLPVKSLLRFRCVSTLWDSTFSNPSFVRSHFSHSLNRSDRHTLLLSFRLPQYSPHGIFSATIPTKTHHQMTQSKPASASATLLLPMPFRSYFHVSDSLQGLICIAFPEGLDWLDEKGSPIFYVYNPSTREIITVRPPTNTDAEIKNYAFGFDPVSYEHKILMTSIIKGDPNKEAEEKNMEHKVFSVRSNQWRQIPNGAQPYYCLGINIGLCVNGFIYRRCIEADGSGSIGEKKEFVVAFNVRTEKFHFFGFPFDSYSVYSSFVIHDGNLTLFDFRGLKSGDNVNYWILKDDGKQQIWVKNSIALLKPLLEITDKWELEHPISIYTGEIIFTLQ